MVDNLILSASITAKLLREALPILTLYKLSVMRKGIFIILAFLMTNHVYSDNLMLPSWASHPQQDEFIGASIPFDDKEIAKTSAEFSALLSYIISLKREEVTVDTEGKKSPQTRIYTLLSSPSTPVGKLEIVYKEGSESNYSVQFSIGTDFSVVKDTISKDGTYWVSIKPSVSDGRDSIIGDFTYNYHVGEYSTINSEFYMQFKGNGIRYVSTWDESSSEKEIIAFGFVNNDGDSFKGIDWIINTSNKFSNEGLYINCPIVKDYGSSYCKGLLDCIITNMNKEFNGLRNVSNSIVNGKSIEIIYEEIPSETYPSISFTTHAAPVIHKRIALVLGNADYKVGRLQNPVNDAKDIASKLDNLGFKTILITNEPKGKTRDIISQFCDFAKQYDLALFYYAGHAIQDQGVNYLIPINATIEAPGDIEDQCIRLPWILRRMNDSGVKAKIVILDACRDNPVTQSWERGVIKEGLSDMGEQPVGTLLLYSALAGKKAKDGIGKRNSPFAEAFLKVLDIPMLPAHDLFHKLKNMVAEETNHTQTPSLKDNLVGDFYFNIKQGK